MPDWIAPLLALIALPAFLYFAFVRTKPAPRSGNDPDSFHTNGGGGPHSGD
jgi:hypothetical protein